MNEEFFLLSPISVFKNSMAGGISSLSFSITDPFFEASRRFLGITLHLFYS